MADLIRLRGGTAADWTAKNPVLAFREPGLESDTARVKYGDGVTAWAALPYADARAPQAHAASHGSAGADPVTPAAIGASPTGHTHTAAQVSDATATGRSVLTAADAAAARSAIGAGTSSLALGTTSTTAKAGDYAPPADAAATVASLRTLGTTAVQAAAGNHTHVGGTTQLKGGTFTGTTSAAGDVTISHGLGVSPVFALATVQGSANDAIFGKAVVTAWSATALTVRLFDTRSGAALTGFPTQMGWLAGVL